MRFLSSVVLKYTKQMVAIPLSVMHFREVLSQERMVRLDLMLVLVLIVHLLPLRRLLLCVFVHRLQWSDRQ